MLRKRLAGALVTSLILLAGLGIFRIGIVFADYNTPVQTTTCQDIAKMGTTTQYGYIGPSGQRDPFFCAALIAKSTQGWWVQSQRIEVSGNDPNGNPLSGTRFDALSVLASPDGSSAEQQILVVIANTLLSLIPYGLGEPVKCTMSAGGTITDRNATSAWAEWNAPTYSYPGERGLELGYKLEVYTTVEGTYTINIHYHTLIEILAFIPGLPILIPMFRALDLYDTVYYTYVNMSPPPSTPSGYTFGYTGTSYSYSTSTTDPNGDSLEYLFDWGDGSTNLTGWYVSGATASASHTWSSLGTYYVKVRAQDSTGAWSDWSSSLTVNMGNRPPNAPSTPSGPTSGYRNVGYTYSTSTIDPDGDNVRYQFEFTGPSTNVSFTTGWYASGQTGSLTVMWETTDPLGTYYVRVRAQDVYDAWSGYSSSLTVTISSGGGCPTLFVWNGTGYVDYGVINIHNPTGEDVIREVPIQSEDVCINSHKAKFRLREGWEGLNFSESVIDQVKLYAIGNDGNRHLCPLISAEHSRLGNVLPQLLLSDDYRVQMLLLETVDLTFVVPWPNIQGFTFVIEGYNALKVY